MRGLVLSLDLAARGQHAACERGNEIDVDIGTAPADVVEGNELRAAGRGIRLIVGAAVALVRSEREEQQCPARDRAAQLTVRFVSQMISVTRDKTGTIVDGNPDKVADITDVWTFARDTTSRDPNWKLVGTGSAH